MKHMRLFGWSGLVLWVALGACSPKQFTSKIAFGSCGHQDYPQPVLALAADTKPDAFVFLGDNIYGDTDVMDTIKAKYSRLAAKPEYQKLASSTKIFATWDDHDYGKNDSGKWYPFKKQSKEIFLDFFKEPLQSERRKHDGIYHAEYLSKKGKTIQLILLDVRSFRSNLLPYDTLTALPRKKYFYELDYKPHSSIDSTLLGSEQWAWLENELSKPADIRLICSGSQFGIEFNGYEAWANFPHEQQRMLDILKRNKVSGVVFLSGDVHYAEISKLEVPGLYPIYDVTASGITSTWDFATLNKNRIEGPIMDNHFGLLSIHWTKKPSVKMEIIDLHNNQRIEHIVRLNDIRFGKKN